MNLKYVAYFKKIGEDLRNNGDLKMISFDDESEEE